MRRVVLLVVSLIVSLGIAACGGGSSSERHAKERLTPADNKIAQQLLLTLADFSDAGGSWARDLDDNDDASDNTCADDAIRTITVTGKADGGNFSEGDGLAQVTSNAVVFADQGSAAKAYSVVATDETMRCLAKYLKNELEDNAKGQDLKVGDIKAGALPSPGIGDRSAGYRLRIPLESQGVSLTFNADLVIAGTGRALTISFFGDLGTFDQALKRSLLTALGGRLSSAAGT